MTPEDFTLDKHQALKLENNRSIKLAALALSEERGIGNFTVEELANRAQVSRRTFFNHFGSIHEATRAGLRDILLEASETAMVAISTSTESTGPLSQTQLFDLAANALMGIDFSPTVTRMCNVLGVQHQSPESQAWFGEVFTAVVADFRELLAQRAPEIPELNRNLLVEALLASLRISAELWLDLGEVSKPNSASSLRDLQAQAIALLRNGFVNH